MRRELPVAGLRLEQRATLLPLIASLWLAACGGDNDASTDAGPGNAMRGPLRSGQPALPEDFVAPPGSELERRMNGTCIPFDPFHDGSGRTVCLMTTPQDGTLGELTTEGEGLAGRPGAGRAAGALLDSPPTPLPARVDHRSQYLDGCVTVSNQQGCGWCVPHAATAVLEALYCSKGCDDVPELSEAHLRSNSLDGRAFGSCAEGWNTRVALRQLVNHPIVDNDTWPYVGSGRALNAGRPSDDVLRARAVSRATGTTPVDLQNLAAVKRALASEREVLITLPVYYANTRAMPMSMRKDWDATVADVQAPPTASPCGCNDARCGDAMCLGGYHAVVLTGYDDAAGEFTFLNSWGKLWGDAGYGRMSYAFLTTYGSGGGVLDDVDTTIRGNACEDDLYPDGGLIRDGGVDASATLPPRRDAGAGDGGASLPPPDRCSHYRDCGPCTASSGCGWCDGVGCRAGDVAGPSDGSCPSWRGDVCDVAADPCNSAHGDCSSCAVASGCEWCADRGVCFSPARRTIDCFDARNAAGQCSDCTGFSDCASCAAADGCGWCPGGSTGVVAPGGSAGSCVNGSTTDSDRTSCEAYRGTAATCPDSCRDIMDCTSCTDTRGCGWCDSSDTCLAGGFLGPAADRSFGGTCGDDWDYFGPFCDNTGTDCGAATGCGACLGGGLSGLCTWCGDTMTCLADASTCMGGSIHDRTMCPDACGGPFQACVATVECCDGLSCVNNDCVDCAGSALTGATCDPTDPAACCGTLACSAASSLTDQRCCRRDLDRCSTDSDCCGRMTCVAGQCACGASGAPCLTGIECCGGSFCDASSGRCT